MKLILGRQKDGQWHQWFAWHPVREDSFIAWMELVQRRWVKEKYWHCIDPYDPGEMMGGWEYRLMAGYR